MKTALKYLGIGIIVVILSFFSLGLLHPTQQYSFTVDVSAPIEKTFSVFNDTSKTKEWISGFSRMENIKGTANETGSQWRMFFRDHDRDIVMTETVTDFKWNERFSFNIKNEVMDSDNEIRFSSKGSGTEISVFCKYKGGNIFWKSLFNFFNSSIIEQQKEQFKSLKKIVEQSNK